METIYQLNGGTLVVYLWEGKWGYRLHRDVGWLDGKTIGQNVVDCEHGYSEAWYAEEVGMGAAAKFHLLEGVDHLSKMVYRQEKEASEGKEWPNRTEESEEAGGRTGQTQTGSTGEALSHHT